MLDATMIISPTIPMNYVQATVLLLEAFVPSSCLADINPPITKDHAEGTGHKMNMSNITAAISVSFVGSLSPTFV